MDLYRPVSPAELQLLHAVEVLEREWNFASPARRQEIEKEMHALGKQLAAVRGDQCHSGSGGSEQLREEERARVRQRQGGML